MKAIPSESWLYPLVCAPTTPQPRPSYTVPSPPTRKLKHTGRLVEDRMASKTSKNSLEGNTNITQKLHLPGLFELLTYIQCHQSLFLSYAFSECWQGGPHTLSGLCSLGEQCGVWSPSGQTLLKSPFVEGQPLSTATLKRCLLKSSFKMIKSIFKMK